MKNRGLRKIKDQIKEDVREIMDPKVYEVRKLFQITRVKRDVQHYDKSHLANDDNEKSKRQCTEVNEICIDQLNT